jgi:uncharacterized phiE125 gp8 family phage protein
MDDRGVPLIVPPATYPVTLAEVKEWCRIDSADSSQDVTLNLLIRMATGVAEHLTGRCFIERTLEAPFPWFERVIELPLAAPLIAVEQVAYTDINGAEQIVDPSVYEIDTSHDPGRIQPKWQKFWPVIAGLGYTFNPVRIRYRAGYVSVGSPPQTPAEFLPDELRVWMQSRMASFYDNRAQFIIGTRIIDVQVPRDFADGVLDGLMVGSRYF